MFAVYMTSLLLEFIWCQAMIVIVNLLIFRTFCLNEYPVAPKTSISTNLPLNTSPSDVFGLPPIGSLRVQLTYMVS